MHTITKTVFERGLCVGKDHTVTLIKEKHNNNEKYLKIERSKVEPYDYEEVKINKAFYESLMKGGKLKNGVTTVEYVK